MPTQHNGLQSHLQPRPKHLRSMLAVAWHLLNQSLYEKAAMECKKIVSLVPSCGEAWHLLGLIDHGQGCHIRAVKQLSQAIEIEPNQPLHHNNLGVVLMSLEKHAQAAASFRHALKISPEYQDARCNLGLSLYHQNRLSSAAHCFSELLELTPLHDGALANLGMTRLAQQRYSDAAELYEKVIAHHQARPEWYANLGTAYLRLDRYNEAADCFDRAAHMTVENSSYQVSRGIALRAAGQLETSSKVLERVISEDPGASDAIANLIINLEYCCQWDNLDLFQPLLAHATRDALSDGRFPDEDPMLNIRRCDDIVINQKVGKAHSERIKKQARRVASVFAANKPTRNDNRITLGYLSYDFRNHPVAHQLFPLFKLHDRSRFRVVVLSTGPDDGSFYRKRISSGCDEFIDIRQYGLNEAVECIQDNGIDILVDLMGHSHHHRMEIFALRPAPVQIGCLGFLSTTGADYIDYLIADSVVVPEAHQPFYTEKLIRLPHCYQMNHTALTDFTDTTIRADWGLPPNAFVFCCFNSVYKVDKALFDAWMRILKQTPGSVLWLNGASSLATENMRARADFLGIDPGRLVFAEKIPLERHLNRLRLADLALDTIRYNGGATTANALSVGLPVITVIGRHWVSRMAASHLYAAGLSELVASTMRAYEKKATDLATKPEKLASLRQHLENSIGVQPLFNPHHYVHHLEAGFYCSWNRYIQGLPPDHINIPSDGVHQS